MSEDARRIAIIGGGIAGLTAAWLLAPAREVTLFEKERRLGGNAYTLDTRAGYPIDVAVAAFGRAGYHNFYGLLGELGIRPRLSPGAFVSLHDLDTARGFYLTPGLRGLAAQRFDLLRPSRLAELVRLARGLARARRMLERGELEGLTLARALARIPEMRGDARRLLLATFCLLSSMGGDEVLAAPAHFLFGKLKVHSDVMSPHAFHSVHCVRGGTRRYVEAMAARFRERIVLGAAIRTVRRRAAGVELIMSDGNARSFDAVIFACNADQALALLEAPSERERALLGAWRYKEGRLVVHRDAAAFPPRPLAQAYTFLYRERGALFETSVNGCTWHQPGVPRDGTYIATQHPNFPIRPDLVELDTILRTPIFDFASVRTISELPSLNGLAHTYYCGSHFGYGVHEDAIGSAIAVARSLGAEVPFS